MGELQQAWDRPGKVTFEPQCEGGGWAVGWEITRPVRMWLGEQAHRYGFCVHMEGAPDKGMASEALSLIREQFDMTMEILDRPAWQRFIHKHLWELDFRVRHHAKFASRCREAGVSLSLGDHVRALVY